MSGPQLCLDAAAGDDWLEHHGVLLDDLRAFQLPQLLPQRAGGAPPAAGGGGERRGHR